MYFYILAKNHPFKHDSFFSHLSATEAFNSFHLVTVTSELMINKEWSSELKMTCLWSFVVLTNNCTFKCADVKHSLSERF